MLKLSLWRKIATLCLVLVVSACGGAGSSAPPPTGGITVTPGNGQAFVTWNADPGVTYWLLYAPTAAALDTQNLPVGHLWVTPVTSPYVVPALLNGTSYTFAINGRTDGGKGGPLSPSVTIVPRAAGANWIQGGTTSVSDLHGIAYGTPDSVNNYYLAVGDNGAMFKALDGVSQSLAGYSWSAVAGPATGTPANYTAAVNMYSRFIAVGVGGGANNIVYGTDLINWTSATFVSGASAAQNNGINALANNGTTLVAVGNGGIAYYTLDGITWTQGNMPQGFTSNLYGVAYSSYTAMWVAVGANGALLTSSDAINWNSGSSGVSGSVNLRSVAATTGNLVVAVGDNGTIITNSTMITVAGGGGTWVTPTVGPTNVDALYAVTTDSVQLLTVGQNGTTYTSLDGLTWTPPPIGSIVPNKTLYSVFGTASRYLGVGLSGSNFSSVN